MNKLLEHPAVRSVWGLVLMMVVLLLCLGLGHSWWTASVLIGGGIVLWLMRKPDGSQRNLSRFEILILAVETRWPYVNLLSRDMNNDKFGLHENVSSETHLSPSSDTAKSHRKFAFSAGGHVARFVAGLMRLVSPGAAGQARLQVARVSA